jgi:hypothetical protein
MAFLQSPNKSPKLAERMEAETLMGLIISLQGIDMAK